jgi:hypothetical protein
MRVRRGLFRLYVVASILWVGWFGYVIYDSSRELSFVGDLIQEVEYDRRAGRPSAYDGMELVVSQLQQTARQRTAEKAILAFPLLAPIIYFVFSWIVRGFIRDDRPEPRPF